MKLEATIVDTSRVLDLRLSPGQRSLLLAADEAFYHHAIAHGGWPRTAFRNHRLARALGWKRGTNLYVLGVHVIPTARLDHNTNPVLATVGGR